MEGGRTCASQRAAEEGRKEERKRWGDTDIQLGEGLRENGVGLMWIQACDWLRGEKKEHVASCHIQHTRSSWESLTNK